MTPYLILRFFPPVASDLPSFHLLIGIENIDIMIFACLISENPDNTFQSVVYFYFLNSRIFLTNMKN